MRFEVRDLLQRRRPERRLVLQRMQRDALQQVAERQVQVLGQALQHFQQPFLQPHAGLDALDFADLLGGFGGHGGSWGRFLAVRDAQHRTVCFL